MSSRVLVFAMVFFLAFGDHLGSQALSGISSIDSLQIHKHYIDSFLLAVDQKFRTGLRKRPTQLELYRLLRTLRSSEPSQKINFKLPSSKNADPNSQMKVVPLKPLGQMTTNSLLLQKYP